MADEMLQPGAGATEIDTARAQLAMDRLRDEQNLSGALLAGAVAALLGAVAWAAVTVTTGYQIGWMAIGIGFAVGFAVRTVGKGLDPIYGIAGAGLALLGCALGNLLAVCGILAAAQSLSFLSVLANLTVEIAEDLMIATFTPMDLLFYGLAGYEGYKLSFRQVSAEELAVAAPI